MNGSHYNVMVEEEFHQKYPNAFDGYPYDNFPRESFLLKNKVEPGELPTYTAIDNRTGNAWTEDFGVGLESAIAWLTSETYEAPDHIYKGVIIESPQRMQNGRKKKAKSTS